MSTIHFQFKILPTDQLVLLPSSPIESLHSEDSQQALQEIQETPDIQDLHVRQ